MIVVSHQRNGAHSNRFLSDVEVKETAHNALIVKLQRDLLKAADAKHLAEEANFIF